MFSALDDFLVYCEIERRLAPLTCSVHHRDVRACLTFLEADGITNLAVVTVRDLRRFLIDEAIRRPSPSSQSRTIAALRCTPTSARSSRGSSSALTATPPATSSPPLAPRNTSTSTTGTPGLSWGSTLFRTQVSAEDVNVGGVHLQALRALLRRC